MAASGPILYHVYKGEHTAMGHDSHGDVGMGIDNVVQLMTVNAPKPRTQSYKLYIPRGPRRDIDCVTGPLGRLGDGAALGTDNFPGMAVEVDRVTAHGQVSEANTYPITLPGGHDLNIRCYLSIKSEPVKIHGDQIGTVISGKKGKSLEHDGKVPDGLIWTASSLVGCSS